MSGWSDMIEHCSNQVKQEASFLETSAQIVQLEKIEDLDYSEVREKVLDGKSALPEEFTSRGLIGPESFVDSKIHCSVAGMKESRQIDQVAQDAVSSTFSGGENNEPQRHGCFGIYYHKEEEDSFVVVRGAKSEALGNSSVCEFEGRQFHPAAFVAISDFTLSYANFHLSKASNVAGDQTLNSFSIKSHKLSNQIVCESEEAQASISQMEKNHCFRSVEIKAGQMFLTVHNMLCKIPAGALIKFIGLEQVSQNRGKKSTMRAKIRETFEKSAFPVMLHANNDWLCASLFKALNLHKTTTGNAPGYEHASLDDFPEFLPQKAVKKEKNATTTSSSSPSSPATDESTINSLLEDGKSLLERARNLPNIVFNPVKTEAFKKNYDDVSEGNTNSVKLKAFKTTMNTLNSMVKEATDNQEHALPNLLEKFDDIESILENEIKIPSGSDFSALRKSNAKYVQSLANLREGKIQDKKDTYKAGTFAKVCEYTDKLLTQVNNLKTNISSKREKQASKIVKKKNDPSLVNPNEKLEPLSYEPLYQMACVDPEKDFELVILETTQEALNALRKHGTPFRNFWQSYPQELTSNPNVEQLIKETRAAMSEFKTVAVAAGKTKKSTGEDTKVDATLMFGYLQRMHDILEQKAVIDEEYENRKKEFEDRQQVMVKNPKKHKRGKIVYKDLTQKEFELEYKTRYRLLNSGQARWNKIAAKENSDDENEDSAVDLEYIGDKEEEAIWDSFHDKMTVADKNFEVWMKEKSSEEACKAFAISVEQAEPLLPSHYHDINNPEDCNSRDDEEEDEYGNSSDLRDLEENFDVPDHDSESNYEEDEDSFHDSDNSEANAPRIRKRERAAVSIVEAMNRVPTPKERNAALKHFKSENYDAAMNEVQAIFDASVAYGFKMTNKKTKTSKEYDDWYLDPAERDLNLEAWANRTDAFHVEPIQMKLSPKKRARDDDEE